MGRAAQGGFVVSGRRGIRPGAHGRRDAAFLSGLVQERLEGASYAAKMVFDLEVLKNAHGQLPSALRLRLFACRLRAAGLDNLAERMLR